MTAFALELGPDADREALRRALARCARPLRVERRHGAARLVLEDRDARELRPRWLRAGLVPSAVPDWPEVEGASGHALAADGRWWCLARVSLARGHERPDALLVLVPVDPADAARAILASLRPRWWSIFHPHAPRALARSCARVLARLDGVVAARALLLVDGASPEEARARLAASSLGRPRPSPLRADAVRAWASIARPEAGGVWRLLSDLEPWWRAGGPRQRAGSA